jgi:hypothetical protein
MAFRFLSATWSGAAVRAAAIRAANGGVIHTSASLLEGLTRSPR